MPTTQITGPIGPFLDSVQRRQVPVMVSGTCDYNATVPIPNPAALDFDVQSRVLRAINDVISPKMASGELQFRNLGEANLGNALNEIVMLTGLPQQGIHIGNLSLRFAIDQGPPQQEVRAHINVGGFNINASSSQGVNLGSLGNQLVNRAKNTVMWYATAGILVVLIVGGVGLYLRHTIRKAVATSSTSSTAAAAKGWDGKTPLTCGGNDELTFSGVTAKLPGTAVTAAGNCKVTLVNADLTGATAVEAMGNATVTLTGGSVTGTGGTAIHAIGNAQVIASGTKASGKTAATGGAKITGL
jgi:hypothetical protein